MATQRLQAQTTPDAPPAGHVTLFVDSADNNLKQLDANGVVIDLTAVGGAGGYAVTGLRAGGALSVNAIEGDEFDVAAGTGVHADWTDPDFPVIIDVVWSASEGRTVDDLLTEPYTSIAIDSEGVIVQKGGAAFTPAERRDLIILGTLGHTNNADIDAVVNNPVPVYNTVHAMLDYFHALGGILKGSEIDATNANMTFVMSEGTYTAPFINAQVDPSNPSTLVNAAANPRTFQYSWRDGLGGFNLDAPGTLIDSETYDSDTGVKVPIPNNDWVVQPVYYFGASDLLFITLGQIAYDNKQDAINGVLTDPDDYIINPDVENGSKLLGFFVVQEGCTDLSNELSAEFVEVSYRGEQ